MTVLESPGRWDRTGASARRTSAPAPAAHQYFAFLSYSHSDEATAQWLHDSLERFVVPKALVGRLTENGPIPRRLTPIFRDIQELAVSDDLGGEIRTALSHSRFLIVLCSPAAARSRWTDAEIDAFRRTRPEGCVLAAILDGEPFASEIPGREAEECLPPSLRVRYDRRGRPTGHKSEPLAADLRGDPEARRIGFLKIVAGMLGVGLDDLVQRETLRKQRRLAVITAGSLVGMLIASVLALIAVQARNTASEQRQEAEALVEFMLGDLKDKLEPLKKLDILDAVGARALAYYEAQDQRGLSDDNLIQRSRALALMGQIATVRGDLDGAIGRYAAAMAGTGELVERDPANPERLFDHAQNIFWVGEIARQRGHRAEAVRAMRQYKVLADRMVAIDPDDLRWRMEVKYANTNLGIVLYESGKFAEAIPVLDAAVRNVEVLAAASPDDDAAQQSVPTTLAWHADALFAAGRIDQAIARRERQVAILDTQSGSGRRLEYLEMAIPAHRALGRWLAARGEVDAGLTHLRRAVAIADQLRPFEPDNMLWMEAEAGARLDLSSLLLFLGRREDGMRHLRSGCDLTRDLRARDRTMRMWHTLDTECRLRSARAALTAGALGEARMLARSALVSAREPGNDAVARALAIAAAHGVAAEVESAAGDPAAARRHANAALAAWPATSVAPRQQAIRATILRSAGRAGEAVQVENRLRAIGYRNLIW